MYENIFPSKRYQYTLSFLKKHIPENQPILDLGVENPLPEIMKAEGYSVQNTPGEDLDLDVTAVSKSKALVVTAFEIFEHLVAPFHVLSNIKVQKLVASIPLRLWFSSAYRSKRSKTGPRDWQFDWLLQKAGWEILDRQKWSIPIRKIGLRPLLRNLTPRYYIVYAERMNSRDK